MYDTRQFRTAMYFLLLLGITGYALATESPVLWFLACSAILFNAWLVSTGRFAPMPRLVSTFLTLAMLGLFAMVARYTDELPILTFSQFIVVLQLIKLYEQRENRDYAQLLILNLLLMVAAAISTASLLFGLTFITYLVVALYCSLMFHLKSETDRARAKYGQPANKINPATLRQDQRMLPRSIRRLTGLIAAFSLAAGVFVFLFFPRGVTEGMFTPMQLHTVQPLTGFSDNVSFQKVAQIAQNDDVIARVEAYYRDKRVTVPFPLLLRGSSLDSYSGSDGTLGQWQWSRTNRRSHDDRDDFTLDSNETGPFWPGSDKGYQGDYSTNYRLIINLEPTGTNKLFAMAGISSITPAHSLHLRFFRHDSVLESAEVLNQPIQYTVVCSNRLVAIDSPYRQFGNGAHTSEIDPQITAFAKRPEVCGVDPAGKPLANYPLDNDHSYDNQIATNFETYLRLHYQYTLDLTNEATWGKRDPLVGFLYDFKKGHCEYFAGAMTLMCQSIGIPARMIVGFRCDAEDFNTLGDYYQVKQSNAHAWCEVFTGSEWQTYDPTTSNSADGGVSQRVQGYFSRWMKVFDYFEYKWANSVIAYSHGDARTLTEAANLEMTRAVVSGGQHVGVWSQRLRDWWSSVQFTVSSVIIAIALIVAFLIIAAAIAWFLYERWRLRRLARRIGMDAGRAQLQLIRRLQFYDDLVRALARRKIFRAKHLTPLEFSRTLSFLPNAMYSDIRRLTELFYRVRYGEAQLDAARQRRLTNVVNRIERALDEMILTFP